MTDRGGDGWDGGERGGPVPPWPGPADVPSGPRTPPAATPWGTQAADPSWAWDAPVSAPPAARPQSRLPLVALAGVLLIALGAGGAAAWPSLSRLLPGASGGPTPTQAPAGPATAAAAPASETTAGQAGQGTAAGLPECPAGSVRLASTVFPDGDWVLVCGLDAASPTAWRSRLGGQEVSSERVSAQPASDGSGAPGGYTAAMADGGSVWLSAAPAMAGRSDGSGHLSYSRAATGQTWFVWLGGAAPQSAEGSYGVPVPAASAADQVRYLSQLLDQSAATRSSLEASVTSIRECRRGEGGDYAADVAGIDSAAANRQQLLTALQTAPVDLIPQGTALIDQLHEALSLSLQVDQWYAAWARSSTASGCAPLAEDGGRTLSDRTGKAKEAFVATWNGTIAPTYGVAQTVRAKI